MVRENQVPASAPEKTLTTMRHKLVPRPDGVTLYRDTNAWCPFCERVWLALLEMGIDYDTVLIDLSLKPVWYEDAVPTSQTPSAVVGGEIVWESLDILLKIEDEGFAERSLLPADPADRERIIAEVRAFDSPDGPGVGGAGYTYMRGAPFGQSLDTPPSEAELSELRATFES